MFESIPFRATKNPALVSECRVLINPLTDKYLHDFNLPNRFYFCFFFLGDGDAQNTIHMAG